ncbi:MAG: hypothetical protein HDQ88_08210 [Clostridia bacterium]|nr:hypothetical protein [Clostridia bacterium]
MKKLVSVVLFCCILLCTLSANAYFVDVDSGAWYAEAVGYVYDNGIMSGVGNDRFSPDTTFSRAMLAQVLYRLEGSPSVDGADPYDDVGETAWYHDAVAWTRDAGIMSGYGNNLFGPDDKITREQLAVVLYRYDSLDDGYDPRILDVFRGGTQVSSWARDAMAWAVDHRLMAGSNSNLMPRKGASRAEVATILMRYLEYDVSLDDEVRDTESYIEVQDGIVRFRYEGDVDKIKARIISGDRLTTYNLENGRDYSYTFPYGPGSYDLVLYENTSGNKYRRVIERAYELGDVENDLSLTSYSSYYPGFYGLELLVDGLWDDGLDDYANVRRLYDWITANVAYDYDRVDDVPSGYMPDLETALYDRKGLCLDYAGLLCTMCRCKGIPAQIVVGYFGDTCHAWSEITIDGGETYADATFGSSSRGGRDKFFDMDEKTYGGYSEDYRF